LVEHGTLRPLVRLAWPVLAEEVLNLLVGYTDWWLTGHYLEGPAYQSAMGVLAYILWLIPSMFAAVAIGAAALTARFVGARDLPLARRVLHQAFLVGFAVSLVATLATIFGGQAFLRLLRLPEEAVPLGASYLSIIAPIVPLIMIEQVAIACLRGAGDTVTGLVAKTVVNVVNLVLSAGLVVGWGPLPELGWQGLAVGTAAGHAVGGLILLGAVLGGRAGLKLRLSELRPDWSLIGRMWRVGLPGGLDVLAVLSCHLTYAAVINSLGTAASAAHGLGVQLEALAYSPAQAFAVAAATLAGQYLGAGDERRASRSVRGAMLGAIAFMTVMATFFQFGGWILAEFFTGNPESATTKLTIEYLRIVSYSLPSLGITIVLTGALRGAGDTIWSLTITFVGLALIRVPLGAFLARAEVFLPGTSLTFSGLDWGVQGAWIAMVVDVVLRSGLLLARYFHGGWKKVAV